MQPRIMITDGGPHSAAKWAEETAFAICELVQVAPNSETPDAVAWRRAKQRFEPTVAEIVETFHANVQKRERDLLAAKGDERLVAPLDPNDGVIDTPEEVAAAVIKAAEGSPFQGVLATDAGKAAIVAIIGDHFSKSMDIERSWYADRRPDDAGARAYRDCRSKFGARNVHLHLAAGGKKHDRKPR